MAFWCQRLTGCCSVALSSVVLSHCKHPLWDVTLIPPPPITRNVAKSGLLANFTTLNRAKNSLECRVLE